LMRCPCNVSDVGRGVAHDRRIVRLPEMLEPWWIVVRRACSLRLQVLAWRPLWHAKRSAGHVAGSKPRLRHRCDPSLVWCAHPTA
jgi:hypothetical protein